MGYDSLLINNSIELLGGPGPAGAGVLSVSPLCPGASFRIIAPSDATGSDKSYSLGAPDPTQDFVESLLLDGERPFGYRSSNRTITLTVLIRAPSRAVVAAARELLLETIDQQTWTLTYTRDPTAGNPGNVALPLVFDCFRALPSVARYGFAYDRLPATEIDITFQALPYGRSDVQQQVAFPSPASLIPSAPPSPVTLDTFTTVTGSGWTQSSVCQIGPNTAFWAAPGSAFASYTRSAVGPFSLTGLTTLTAWLGLAATTFTNWSFWHRGTVSLTFTITDGTNSLTFAPHVKRMFLTASNSAGSPFWHQVSAAIPPASAATPGSINMAAITGYTVTIQTHSGGPYGLLCSPSVYLDALIATPVAQLAAPASVRGWVYNLNGVLGSAHAPISVTAQQPAVSAPTTVVLTGAGNWIPPAGVSAASVQCIGGGGSGSTLTSSGVGGGGGGGESATEAALALSGSAPIPYSCGAGGIPGGTGVTVVQFTSAGTATFTVPPGITSLVVECWAGGGGGGIAGSGGGGGEYAANASFAVVPGQVYTIKVGGGGSGGNYFTNFNGGGGGTSSLSGTGGSVTAHGGQGGVNGSATTAAGGTGSSASVHQNGGTGGGAPSSGGGGGGEAGNGPPGSSSAGGNGGSGGSLNGGAGGSSGNGGNGGGGGNSSSTPGGNGAAPGGGGGGSGSYSGLGGGSGGTGMVQVTYGASGGTPATSAGNTVFGPAGSPLCIAHGGTSAATNSAAGGAGGTGSSDTAHFGGAAGITGVASTYGGGGGSSAGPAGAGVAGVTSTGGIPPAGGGKGGNGATGSGNPGQAGVQPGGGGGGAWSSGAAQSGGAGGAGQITITYTATLAPFSTIILHRPGPGSPQSLTPFVSTTSASDPPDGRPYLVPSLIANQNARFNGTYTMWLVAYIWDTPANARTVTITVTQYEYAGGPSTVTSVSRVITPASDVTSQMIDVGVLTLPYRDMAPDNSTAYFTVGITSTDTSDRFLDVLFLDTQGQTVIIATPANYVNFYFDAPTSDVDIGRILGSAFDRTEAVSVIDSALAVSGGPLTVDPGDNVLVAYSLNGPPALALTYYGAWMLDRTS